MIAERPLDNLKLFKIKYFFFEHPQPFKYLIRIKSFLWINSCQSQNSIFQYDVQTTIISNPILPLLQLLIINPKSVQIVYILRVAQSNSIDHRQPDRK